MARAGAGAFFVCMAHSSVAQDAASLVPQVIRDRGVLHVGSQQTFRR